jgi:hypothetical protein
MEPEGSLPHSQELSTCPYPEPDQSTPQHSILSLRSILILSTHLHLGFPGGLFPSVFPTNNLYAFLSFPIRATCPAHLILYLIILIVLGEEYKSRTSSLCSFLHLLVTSSLLSPNLLSTCSQTPSVYVHSLISRDKVSQPYRTTAKIIVL